VPLVIEATETVEEIVADDFWQWVITDQHAYRFVRGSTVLVSVGQVVHSGEPLTNTLEFYEFNRGQVPPPEDIRALAIGRGFLAEGYFQDLVFENKIVPTVVTTDDLGLTKIEFEVGGFPGDVDRFWNTVHAKGVVSGQTLAHLLDQRTIKVGEPGPIALPTTINPLGFLLQNLFRQNLTVVVVKPSLFGPNALGTGRARVLNKLVPPHTALILLAELRYSDPPIKMEGPGTDTDPGYDEAVKVFLGFTTEDVIDPNVMVAERVRVIVRHGHCE